MAKTAANEEIQNAIEDSKTSKANFVAAAAAVFAVIDSLPAGGAYNHLATRVQDALHSNLVK